MLKFLYPEEQPLKKILLMAMNSFPSISTLLNIAQEKSAQDFEVRFLIEVPPTINTPFIGLIQSLGYYCYPNTYQTFAECVLGFKKILEDFAPDIVINDASLAGGLATRILKISQTYAFMRRFNFPNIYLNDTEKSFYQKVLEHDVISVFSKYFDQPLQDPRELLLTPTIFIPSIPYFDRAPEEIAANRTIIYTGPKLWDLGQIDEITKDWIDRAKKSGEPLVLFTTGLLYDPTEFLRHLLPLAAKWHFNWLVTYNGNPSFSELDNHDRFYVTPILPLSALAGAADIMLHHGGHQTSLLAMSTGLPGVTFSTGHPEWEENATISETLCTSLHTRIPSPESIINNLESGLNNYFMKSNVMLSQKHIQENRRDTISHILSL